jgi:hypothetical protein
MSRVKRRIRALGERDVGRVIGCQGSSYLECTSDRAGIFARTFTNHGLGVQCWRCILTDGRLEASLGASIVYMHCSLDYSST